MSLWTNQVMIWQNSSRFKRKALGMFQKPVWALNKISAPYIIKQIKRAVWRSNLLLGILTPLNLMIETMCSADSQASPSDEMIRKRPRVKTIARRHHNVAKSFLKLHLQYSSNNNFTNEIFQSVIIECLEYVSFKCDFKKV